MKESKMEPSVQEHRAIKEIELITNKVIYLYIQMITNKEFCKGEAVKNRPF